MSFFGDNQDAGSFFAPSLAAVGLYQPGIIPIQWPDKLNPRVDFNPTELNKMIWNYGLAARWQLWSPCPCGTSQAASVDCPQCGGTGKYYHSEQEILAVMINVRKDWKQFEKMNPMEPGTATFIVRGEHVPALGDRITLLTAHMPLSIVGVRKAPLSADDAPAIETLRYPILPQVIPVQDAQGNKSERSYGVMFLQAQGTDGLPGARLVEGTDFTVTDDGEIDWALGDALETTPLPGSMYSIYYRTRPVFQVQEYPFTIRDTMTQRKSDTPAVDVLPVEFVGRLEWLIEGGA